MATLKFTDGATLFRPRLICSLLSHRPILIRNIRPDSLTSPGLQDHEASFLRLLDKITNGTKIEINTTGTQLRFFPGVLIGGTHDHTCPNSRGIGYFLEGILPLGPFGKQALRVTLEGVTDGKEDLDPSPDYFATSILPLLPLFGVGRDDDAFPKPEIRIMRRGAAPLGGGIVTFSCPIVKELSEVELIDFGKVKRVRGSAISCRINPSSGARVAHAAKGVLHRLLPDVWIHTDVYTGSSKTDKGCGESPGLKVHLSAETTSGVVLCTETYMGAENGDGVDGRSGRELPEELGQRAAALVLEEIRRGGCVDTSAQGLALIWMALGPEDVSRLRIGMLTHYTIGTLRLLKECFGVEFRVKRDEDDGTILMSCLGSGYSNMVKVST